MAEKRLPMYSSITTKEELFRVIRELTREGYFFRIENFYQGGKADRAAYMIDVLGLKTPVEL